MGLTRYWSGQITEGEIVEICRGYQTELLLLESAKISGEWKALLEAEYRVAYQDKEFVLYTATRLDQ